MSQKKPANPRFVASVVKTAAAGHPPLPWTRGAPRAAFIAKRSAAAPARKTG